MLLIKLENACLNYGHQILLDGVELNVYKGQRLCLIGRNGTGKSSLLQVISGDLELDSGHVWSQQGIKIARLQQDLPDTEDICVYDTVAKGLQGVGELLVEYRQLAGATDVLSFQRLGELQQLIETQDGWRLQQKVESILSRLSLSANKLMGELSGGWRRRVALAKALVADPDVLLLDEPTNHLDIVAVEWLERMLQQFNGALIFITHDRALLQKLATHIAELDRGHLFC